MHKNEYNIKMITAIYMIISQLYSILAMRHRVEIVFVNVTEAFLNQPFKLLFARTITSWFAFYLSSSQIMLIFLFFKYTVKRQIITVYKLSPRVGFSFNLSSNFIIFDTRISRNQQMVCCKYHPKPVNVCVQNRSRGRLLKIPPKEIDT